MSNTTAAAAAASEETKTFDSNSFYAVNSPAQWKKQLITKEDPNHVHKSLGIAVLCSYVYRLSQLGETDLGFLTKPWLTIPTILLHLALNASSFEFVIPAKRIASGYRIWPEYRLHSLVFLVRNLAMMTLFWVETEFHLDPKHWMNLVIILSTMAAADLSSMSQGKHQSGFARELDVPAVAKYFFSIAQFYATSMILAGHRRYTMHFLMIIIIQGNAFLMTVRRKNLASHGILTTIYGLALAGAGIVAHFEFSRAGLSTVRAVGLIANIAVILRTSPRLPVLRLIQNNKYALWIAMYFLLERIRPTLDEEFTARMRAVNLSSAALLIGLGLYKHLKEKREQAVVKSV